MCEKNVMDQHLAALQTLCRFCGDSISEKGGYKSVKLVEDYKDVIYNQTALKDVIINDDPNIHPKALCNKCHMKLYRLKKKPSKKDANLAIFEYKAHVNDFSSCWVCQNGTVSLKLLSKETLKSAVKYGFQEIGKNLYGHGSSESVKILKILDVGKYTVSIHGKPLKPESLAELNFPNYITSINIDDIFKLLDELEICTGNEDFSDLVSKKLGKLDDFNFLSVDKRVNSHLETSDGKTIADLEIIRHENCAILVHPSRGKRCEICTQYRSTLHAMRSRKRKSNEDAVSLKTNNRYLDREQLIQKIELVQKEKANLIRKFNQQKKYVTKQVFEDGVILDNNSQNICSVVLQRSENPFSEDSPQHLLWSEQKKYSMTDPRGMRWHPLIIRWSLSIYLKSPGTYKHIQSGPFMYLPSKNTLLKYINFTTPGCGFNPDIIKRLVNKVKPNSLNEAQRNVGLAFDEMKIKSGLVFDKLTGKLVGFSEMGEINDELERFERFCEEDGMKEKSVAKYVMVFMARGLCSGLEYVFGHFASEGFTSDQIFHCAHEAIGILESIGLKVRCVTADGATPNRKYFELHKLADGTANLFHGSVYWAYNPWSYSSKRKLYFFSDPPHLLKTTRNNLENSYANKNSRNLVFDGKDMGWHQIKDVYEWDLGPSRYCLGIRFGHKLRQEHIKLDPRSRMRVNLAAQVLSSTVADLLEEQREAGEAFGTESLSKFIRLMDTFFDCLNVSRYINTTGKKAKDRYEKPDDWRFEWLEKTFLKFFDEWDEQIDSQLDLKADEKAKLKLSQQTLTGLRITTMSFIELGKLLLGEEKADFFLSEKISQDPVEEHFSKQRQRLGPNENPDLDMFNRNTLGYHVTGDELIKVLNGNVRNNHKETKAIDVHDMTRLPTKKHKL